MVAQASQNPSYCGSQIGKAKSQKGCLVARIARLARVAPPRHAGPPGHGDGTVGKGV